MNHHPKIIVRVLGGLGNQLFCYAAARRLAIVNNAELAIDHVSGFTYDHNYKRNYQLDHFNIPCRKATAAERMEPFARIRRYIKREVNRCRSFTARSYIKQEGIDFDQRLLSVRQRGKVYLEGSWQSQNYFKDVDAQIRQDLRIISPMDITNQSMAKRIRACQAVAIHVRFFDEPQAQGINNVHNNYYVRAIARMEIIAPNAKYFVFSDNPAAALACIPLPENRLVLVTHNNGEDSAFADLWLMSLCQHFIIANSTFSWWGAWLADLNTKKVISPGSPKRHGVSSWGFDGLLPEEWLKI